MVCGQSLCQVSALLAGSLLLAGCDVISEKQNYDDAVRLCQARAADAVEGIEAYSYRDIVYSPAPDHFVAMIADRGAPPDHALLCELNLADGKVSILKSFWDGKAFSQGDRVTVAAGPEVQGLSTSEGAR